ncbi:Rid family detoxifying hydrolase [Thermovibrio sp.]
MKEVRTERAPRPVASYSQGILYGDLIFVSGQLGIDPSSGELLSGFKEQSLRALENVRRVVEAAGGSRCSIVRIVVYLTEIDKFKEFNEVYSDFFKRCPVKPTRVAVGVKELPLGALVEVECIAVRG